MRRDSLLRLCAVLFILFSSGQNPKIQVKEMALRPGRMKPNSFYFDGVEIEWAPGAPVFVGAALVEALGDGATRLPRADEPPYLFCANGTCRDCNLLAEGLADVPSCRLFVAPGMSFRSGEGAGEENALSRRLGPVRSGEPLVAEVVVVGAGPAGRAAAEEARSLGVETLLLEARADANEDASSPRSVGVAGGEPFVMEAGARRVLRAKAIVLATGARDADPRVPGSTLAGVLPLALLSRYVSLGRIPGTSVLVAGESNVREEALRELGAQVCTFVSDARSLLGVTGRNRVERARVRGPAEERDLEVDLVFVGMRREPSLELAHALGCRTIYDRELGYDRLVIGDDGTTSVAGIFACGDVVRIGTEADAREGGRLAGRAAASRRGARRGSGC
jgi:thioredoxin reductase